MPLTHGGLQRLQQNLGWSGAHQEWEFHSHWLTLQRCGGKVAAMPVGEFGSDTLSGQERCAVGQGGLE